MNDRLLIINCVFLHRTTLLNSQLWYSLMKLRMENARYSVLFIKINMIYILLSENLVKFLYFYHLTIWIHDFSTLLKNFSYNSIYISKSMQPRCSWFRCLLWVHNKFIITDEIRLQIAVGILLTTTTENVSEFITKFFLNCTID